MKAAIRQHLSRIRASAILVARAKEIGAEVIVTASTGNAGAALAGMSAAVDQESVIFAPKTAPPAKIAQLLIYGARVILVDDNYDAAYKLSLEAQRNLVGITAILAITPSQRKGKRQLPMKSGSRCCLPTNWIDPCVCLSLLVMAISFLGSIKGLRIFTRSVRSKICRGSLAANPLVQQQFIMPINLEKKISCLLQATTMADSISVNLPSDGFRALRAATQTDGAYIAVEDQQILEAISDLGKLVSLQNRQAQQL